jgi:exosortase/archaeosortase family protein
MLLGFLARMLGGWVLATVLLALFPAVEHAMVAGTVTSVAVTLGALGFGPAVSGTTVTVGSAGLRIIPECTPLMPFLLFAIALLSWPAPWRWRLAGIGAGAVVLWAFNVLRMLGLLATLARWPDAFQFVHVYLWQTATLLVVSALFMLWLRHAPGRRRARVAAAA